MPLTLRTHRTCATVSNAGRVEHTQRAIVFGAAFLWVERGSLWTAQRAIGLQVKMFTSQASHTSRACPLRGTDQRVFLVKARRWVERQRDPREGKPPFEPLQTPSSVSGLAAEAF